MKAKLFGKSIKTNKVGFCTAVRGELFVFWAISADVITLLKISFASSSLRRNHEGTRYNNVATRGE